MSQRCSSEALQETFGVTSGCCMHFIEGIMAMYLLTFGIATFFCACHDVAHALAHLVGVWNLFRQVVLVMVY